MSRGCPGHSPPAADLGLFVWSSTCQVAAAQMAAVEVPANKDEGLRRKASSTGKLEVGMSSTYTHHMQNYLLCRAHCWTRPWHFHIEVGCSPVAQCAAPAVPGTCSWALWQACPAFSAADAGLTEVSSARQVWMPPCMHASEAPVESPDQHQPSL